MLEDNDYGRAVDWWGVGVVMYEMICGHLPFYNRNHEVLFDLILHEEIRLPQTLSSPAKDILQQLLNKDPRARLGGGERDGRDVQDHEFFYGLDFDKLYNLQIPAPFVPKIKGKDDVSNFDSVFTNEKARISPSDEPTPQDEKDQAFEEFKADAGTVANP